MNLQHGWGHHKVEVVLAWYQEFGQYYVDYEKLI
jgi:hypothetical protein